MSDFPEFLHGYPSRLLVEEIILEMAEIVIENRVLKNELEKAREYDKKYHDLLNEEVRNSQKSNAMLLKCVLAGCFNTAEDRKILDEHYGRERENKDEDQTRNPWSAD